MGLFALKRYAKEGNATKHHLSLVSHDDWSVIANADLPFKDEAVYGSSCRGLVYFMGKNGQIVVCNLATRKWKVFPLPDYLSTSSTVYLDSCGLGYDPKSGDYKLFRNIIHFYNEDICVGDEVIGRRYLGYKDYTEVYSFKSCSWKAIRTPDSAIVFPCAVYVGGSCYWTACGLGDDPWRHHILAFDIATECFDHISFPQTSIGQDALCKVVEYRGFLAALIYGGRNAIDCANSSLLHINLFVRREETWHLLFDSKLENVERPLGLGESCDGSILFLEGNHKIQNNIQTSELMVYNFHSKELKKLGIYDYRSHMIAISFDIKKYRPRGSTPMAFVDNIVPSSENVEEMKTEIDLMKNRPRMKVKSGRKKKKKKTVFELLPKHPAAKRRRR